MTQYANQLPDFLDLLRASAQAKNLPAAIVEKDYYLTRVLCVLVEKHSGQFVLKGGTSLSKGWQLLQRFSEDIDLLLKSESGWGEVRRDKLLKGLERTVAGTEDFTAAGKVREATRGLHRTVVFAYPSTANDLPGLSKTIRLEMGYRGQAAAAVKRPLGSMVTELAASQGLAGLAGDLRSFEIDMQSLCRTFVEKLFACYAAYEVNRAAGKTRHYYDLYELCKINEVKTFAGTAGYRQVFAEVKGFVQEQFINSPVPAGESFSDSPPFRPTGENLKQLEQNYKRENLLFFSEPPTLTEVLAKIGEILPML